MRSIKTRPSQIPSRRTHSPSKPSNLSHENTAQANSLPSPDLPSRCGFPTLTRRLITRQNIIEKSLLFILLRPRFLCCCFFFFWSVLYELSLKTPSGPKYLLCCCDWVPHLTRCGLRSEVSGGGLSQRVVTCRLPVIGCMTSEDVKEGRSIETLECAPTPPTPPMAWTRCVAVTACVRLLKMRSRRRSMSH